MIVLLLIHKIELSPEMWALVGVAVGALLTGIINYFLQRSQFRHNREMFFLQNESKEQVMEILDDLLNHRTHTDRSFDAIKKRIGGYSDNEIRKLLHAVGAQKASRTDKEMWYLIERQEERIAKKIARNKKDKQVE